MNLSKLSEWRTGLRKHPYAHSSVILVFIVLSLGGIRWWGGPTVLLTVDGMSRKLHTRAGSVGELLKERQVTLGPEDFCTPPLEAPIQKSMVIQITRVRREINVIVETQKPRIYARAQLKTNLRPILVERGFVQISSRTVETTFYNGVNTSEKVLKKKNIRKTVFKLTLFNKLTGRPEKVYDLTKARKIIMRATGYYVGEKYVPSDTTFLGYKLRRGLVAVDPTVIPLRSRLYVKGYGYAYAADTGSAIKGNRIDLAVKDKKEEAKFNRHNMEVYVLEKAKKW